MLKNGIYTIRSPKGVHRNFLVQTSKGDEFGDSTSPLRIAWVEFRGRKIVSYPARHVVTAYDVIKIKRTPFGVLSEDGREIFVWRRLRSPFGGPPSTYEKYADMLLHREHYVSYGYEYTFQADFGLRDDVITECANK